MKLTLFPSLVLVQSLISFLEKKIRVYLTLTLSPSLVLGQSLISFLDDHVGKILLTKNHQNIKNYDVFKTDN